MTKDKDEAKNKNIKNWSLKTDSQKYLNLFTFNFFI